MKENIYELSNLGNTAVFTDVVLDKGDDIKRYNINGEFIEVVGQIHTRYPLLETNIESKINQIKCDDYSKAFKTVEDYNNFAKEKEVEKIEQFLVDSYVYEKENLYHVLIAFVVALLITMPLIYMLFIW